MHARTVVVTGASAGIGRAIAKAFAKEGARVALVARGRAALEQVAAEIEAMGGQALVMPCDVSSYDQLESVAVNVVEALGPIDIWVNCAMATVFSRISDLDPEEFRRVTDVTYHGTVFGTMVALKRMSVRNRGHIIQVGSALSYRSIPLQGPYCGAKHAMKGFTDALRTELIHEKSAIELSVVQLPAFNTPQFVWARNHMHYRAQPLPPIYDPALAAEAVLWTARHPQREVWVGWPSWKAIIGQHLFPGLLDRYLADIAWKGQFTGEKVDPHRADNLFEPVEELHSEHGPFSDRSITRAPPLWHLSRPRWWLGGAAAVLVLGIFLAGLGAGVALA